MSQACQQLLLDEEYVVINIHHRDSSDSTVCLLESLTSQEYSRETESILSGIPGLVVYINDILITGKTEADHFKF